MGFFGKRETSSRNASDDDAIKAAPPVADAEKQAPSHEDDVQTALPQIPQASVNVDPALERRILRKLDLRVPTLLGFLCMPHIDDLSASISDIIAPQIC